MTQTNKYGWFGYDDDEDVYPVYKGDLPEKQEVVNPGVGPQCWDTKKYDGDKIAEITRQMCKGVR